MCSDIEMFINIIFLTNVMKDLKNKSSEEYLKGIEQTQNWEKFKNARELLELENVYINAAIKEILQNERFCNMIKEDTDIDLNDFLVLEI